MARPERRRARNMAEFGALVRKMFPADLMTATVRSFHPRPNDVVITPYGKCGTTWLQQMFHTLRTRGDDDYDDISRVVPWIEVAGRTGIDLDAVQRASPRGFKSHLDYEHLPKGARYIVCLRDPKDALVSLFRFMEGWFIEPGTIPIEDVAKGWIAGGPEQGGYWQHLISWWRRRDDPDVLIVSFAQMKADPAGHIADVAHFCDIPLDDELLALTVERTSLAYMLAHKDKFDDAIMRQLSEDYCDLPPGSDSAKVRKGSVGGHTKDLPAALAARLDAIWADRVAPTLGFEDYAALEAEIAEHRAVSV